jgi:hypothetical protein
MFSSVSGKECDPEPKRRMNFHRSCLEVDCTEDTAAKERVGRPETAVNT